MLTDAKTTRNDLKIEVNGIITSYEDSGKHTLPVIFIHGFPLNKSAWEPQFDFLKETQRVIIYDLPGFGQSGPSEENKSIHGFADHFVKFMDALKIDKAIVCGLSMGGYIALNAVQRYLKRFEALILSDTQCLADSKENADKRFDTILKIQKNGLKDFAEGFLKSAFSKCTVDEHPELVEKVRNIILNNSEAAISNALKAMANRKESCSALKDITVPTLILCGEEDGLTPTTLSEFLFNHIPNSELHTIKKAGHLSNLEQSDIFNDHLHNFISDIII